MYIAVVIIFICVLGTPGAESWTAAGKHPLEAILVIFGRRVLSFLFCLKPLGKK